MTMIDTATTLTMPVISERNRPQSALASSPGVTRLGPAPSGNGGPISQPASWTASKGRRQCDNNIEANRAEQNGATNGNHRQPIRPADQPRHDPDRKTRNVSEFDAEVDHHIEAAFDQQPASACHKRTNNGGRHVTHQSAQAEAAKQPHKCAGAHGRHEQESEDIGYRFVPRTQTHTGSHGDQNNGRSILDHASGRPRLRNAT
ncbi:hypothetical protein GQR58_030711 [Nymphon striatum]|nr:hypothetical protein GQR58_030711 [Nymphon striatum]